MNSHALHTVLVYSQINKILVDWNPLQVVGPALQDEYTGFIPALASAIQVPNEDVLYSVIRKMFTTLGLEMDDAELDSEIKLLCEQLKMLKVV